jgi:hypothetical protein
MRAGSAAISVASVLGGLLIGGTSALGAGAPSTRAGGTINVFATPAVGYGHGTALITGAIADHGTTLNIDRNGNADPSGLHTKVTLTMGSFEVDGNALNASLSLASPNLFNQATCSVTKVATAPVTLLAGTGLYKGIIGTLNVTVIEAAILPRFASGKHKGQCNTGINAKPIAIWGSVDGSGMVQFG